MRVKLPDNDRKEIFDKLARTGVAFRVLARQVGVARRTLQHWRRGTYTIPLDKFTVMAGIAGIDTGAYREYMEDDLVHTRRVARMGAMARVAKYGPLATVAGRSSGGRRSFERRRNTRDDIFTRASIKAPGQSKEMAEFVGIMLGAGGITNYQVKITSGSNLNHEYSIYAKGLTEKLFGLRPTITKRKDNGRLIIAISSVELVEYLVQLGLPVGNKLEHAVDIPDWVKADDVLYQACLKGIFDTDGCIYEDRHKTKEKIYSYPRFNIVSKYPRLRASIVSLLAELGCKPKVTGKWSIGLDKREDIARFFDLVGSSNPKHLFKWQSFEVVESAAISPRS